MTEGHDSPTGRLTLYRGDSLAVLPKLPSESVDCILTDPPYSSGGLFRGDRSKSTNTKYVQTGTLLRRPDFMGDNKDQRSFRLWSLHWMLEAFRIAKETAPIMVFTDWRQLPETSDALQMAGFIWRGVVVWDKTEGSRPQKGRFRNQTEFVVWGSKGEFPERDGAECLPGVFRICPRPEDKERHIAGKPVNLLKYLTRLLPEGNEREGGYTLLDPFMGGGSTGAAALSRGMKFIGIEQSREIYQRAKTWLSGIDRQMDVFDSWGEAEELANSEQGEALYGTD